MRTLFRAVSLFTFIIAMTFTSLASAACRIPGAYQVQDKNSVWQLSLFPDHTFKRSSVDMTGSTVVVEVIDTGSWTFIPGCAAKIGFTKNDDDDNDSRKSRKNDIYIKFTNFDRVGENIIPNVGLFEGGSMFRIVKR